MKRKVTINEIREIAESFIKDLLAPPSGGVGPPLGARQEAVVVGLYGELGSGKTVFTKEVAAALDVKEHVVSPTFVIERIYHIPERTKVGENKFFDHLIHIDAYRLESEDELLHLGWDDIAADPRNLIFVEWADRVKKILPKDHIQIHFKHINETTREIEIKIPS